jgi:hypothetical protein
VAGEIETVHLTQIIDQTRGRALVFATKVDHRRNRDFSA